MNKKNLLEKKDLEKMLARDKRTPVKFLVIYANNPDWITYDSSSMIQWKKGVVRCTVKFLEGEWVWHDGEAAKHDSKRVRKK